MLVLSPIPELFNQLSGLLTTLLAVAAAIIGVVAWSKRSIVRLWFKQGQLALSESAVTAAQKLVDESQQLTIANLKTTLDAVTVRLKLLEDTMADKETAHAADMALLHAQLSKELNKKDEIIRDSQARIAELEIKAETLSAELQQARNDLARYAQQQVRKEEDAAARASAVTPATQSGRGASS